ncbi:MAG: DUF3078 domain-containing protein [Alphaproteobacteria bacterium]|nr:DUF3078 domain-containing protein [Alphaproteobacteria bacterium]
MKKILIAVMLVMAPIAAFAEMVDVESPVPAGSTLVLNIRRIGLDWSQTTVRNAAAYSDSPIQQLSADSQDFIRGVGDIALEYEHGRFKWENALFTEYGRTRLKPTGAPTVSNENADKILLSSNASYAVWEAYSFKFGPTARSQYETEYTRNGDAPRRNLARVNAGLALFDHAIIRDLYLVGVYEYDFTFPVDVSKFALEFGWRLEYNIKEGVRISTNGYYREYLDYSYFLGVDLERDLSATLRLDTNLWNNFNAGPYIQYRRAKSREADVYASNMMVGVSFNYITSFGLR